MSSILLFFIKIPVIADLPVGENLQDHVGAAGMHFVMGDPVSLLPERIATLTNVLNFLASGKGNSYINSFIICFH